MRGYILGAVLLAGCSTGPQLPVTTPVVNVACTWNVAGPDTMVEDNDCLIDRSSAEGEAETIGNEITTGDISPSVDVPINPTPSP